MNIENITAGEHYVLFTDGACSGNPGPGGWGAVLYRMDGDTVLKGPLDLSGGIAETTNNAMELTAAMRGLARLPANGVPVVVCTDSQYVAKGMTEWLPNWIERNWWKKDGTPVANTALWQELLAIKGDRQTCWKWVKGHSGQDGNERADKLARLAVVKMKAALASRHRR